MKHRLTALLLALALPLAASAATVKFTITDANPPGDTVAFRIYRAPVTNGTPGTYTALVTAATNVITVADHPTGDWAYRATTLSKFDDESPMSNVKLATIRQPVAPTLEISSAVTINLGQ